MKKFRFLCDSLIIHNGDGHSRLFLKIGYERRVSFVGRGGGGVDGSLVVYVLERHVTPFDDPPFSVYNVNDHCSFVTPLSI